MVVLHSLKGRIDSLFQKNNQDKGEFWFHVVKFKGKLNSGKEKESETEGGPQTTFSTVSSLPPILKNIYCFLANKSGICIREHVAIWSLGDGLFICIPCSWMSRVWLPKTEGPASQGNMCGIFFLSTSGENALLRRCNGFFFNSISPKGYDWECFCLFQNDKITCVEKY